MIIAHLVLKKQDRFYISNWKLICTTSTLPPSEYALDPKLFDSNTALISNYRIFNKTFTFWNYLAISGSIRQYLELFGNVMIMPNAEDSLFIKQASILEVIREHTMISSKELKRRFLGIKERTLRYHIKKLQDANLIRKRGATKGVYYEYINAEAR